jgi:NADH:ubiquinone oxidoreductase subunit 5 (subunit L)/multisubunit Na+/H+ antiporter MnhA subunit
MEYIFICQLLIMIICSFCAARLDFDSARNHKRIALLSMVPAVISLVHIWHQSILPVVAYKHLCNFMEFGNCSCGIGLLMDSMSLTVSCVVCIITVLVNFYSIGYVKKQVSIFLLYINSLSFATIMFTASNNLLQMGIFWLLFSIITYFITTTDGNTASSPKALLAVTLQNISDMGFIIAIVAVLRVFNTLTLDGINKYLAKNDAELVQLESIALVLLVSILAKIIQVGFAFCKEPRRDLPIPAVAMVNAVSVVPASIFLLIRLPALFECSVSVQNMIIIAGTLVAIYYGVKSVFSNRVDDLCHNASYSQAGLMMIMCGFSAYGSAIMLFVVNAFAKTLMILAFGSLAYAISGEKNINGMGGLIDLLPKTFASLMVVIASIVPHYYFYSVFLSEMSSSELSTYHLASTSIIATSFMTTVYLFRNIRLIFLEKSMLSETLLAYTREDNSLVIRPLYYLMFLSLFGGVIFYAVCFQEVFWKDVFAFSVSSSNAVIILLLYSVSAIGIICSNFKNKSTADDTGVVSALPLLLQKTMLLFENLQTNMQDRCGNWIVKLASVTSRILHQKK